MVDMDTKEIRGVHEDLVATRVARQASEAKRLEREGLYHPDHESSACGVGMVAAIDGTPSRTVVLRALEALRVLWHRGAVDADGKTGDGAGIHLQIPHDFFVEHIERSGHRPGDGPIAVGMVFLPRTNLNQQERMRQIVERTILEVKLRILGWRQVPVNPRVIGPKANVTRPEIEQVIITTGDGLSKEAFETLLYQVRRRVENRLWQDNLKEGHICSFSCRSIIYKGLFLAEQLDAFYPDLLDARFVSNFAIYHQRYSTNTFPTWSLAQPFRVLAHNGEINTILGNSNWTKSHEARLHHPELPEFSEYIRPLIRPGASDSAALDAVAECLIRAGSSLPEVKAMLIPPAYENNSDLNDDEREFYGYLNAEMEPWDGPAAICAYGGRFALAGMDRNGLRPLRYHITNDPMLIVGSESGMVNIMPQDIVESGRIGPGESLGVDLREGRLYRHKELQQKIAAEFLAKHRSPKIISLDDIPVGSQPDETQEIQKPRESRKPGASGNREALIREFVASGWSMEDLELMLHPMAVDGKEPTGSMGDDGPLAVLSGTFRPFSQFFRQNFSQVTNPPIDSLRERSVMSLTSRIGNLGNILDRDWSEHEIVTLTSPVIDDTDYEKLCAFYGGKSRGPAEIRCLFNADTQSRNPLEESLNRLRDEAERLVRSGAGTLFLTDEGRSAKYAAIPAALAVGAVHSHLVRRGLRTFASIILRSHEVLDPHGIAVLIGVGATVVNPTLAFKALGDRHARGLFGDQELADVESVYLQAAGNGLLKIMSKMGISVISSYRGGYNFEALGLNRALVDEFFPGMPSRISGIGLKAIEIRVLEQLGRAFSEDAASLPVGGFFRIRQNGSPHGWSGDIIHELQKAVTEDSYSTYHAFSRRVRALPPMQLRDLLDFRMPEVSVPLNEVEAITDLRKRFVAPGISLGALSPIAHETLSISMNRIGARSDSGEGGEDPERLRPRPNGDNASSAIKQIASGRFGVTAEYLTNCREIEIKMAQGAKPGEGGQLPGRKVSPVIARLRHSTEGVTLISPPPHHDIYSIEDLAQLIYDLKQINPDAEVCVKLVARAGIGTVAAGVAKAHADTILISGHSGGTGASPLSSIYFAGLPWEMGLAEAHQVLTLNGLRSRVRLRTDGGIRTGRDVVIAALLGAEEFGVGTASLISMGCLMVRQCHSNTCPVGVCTQNSKLIERFTGTPEKVVNLFSFIAEEVREYLARLGARSLDEIIGRTDLLSQVQRGVGDIDDLDLNSLLVRADDTGEPTRCTRVGRNPVPDSLDGRILKDAEPLFSHGEKMQLQYNVRTTDRAIGTRLSAMITRKFGMKGLQPGHITVKVRGWAGQSFGAFAVGGLKLELVGEANDYVGKGLSGGVISLRPHGSMGSVRPGHSETIMGNTCIYGATDGRVFAAGQAGERFCVRNSGAVVVIEGCGSNGCEYMTGGIAVILGEVGLNFAAGMTGGFAFCYDPEQNLAKRMNMETAKCYPVANPYWQTLLHSLLEEHLRETSSARARELLESWDESIRHFAHIVPDEPKDRLEAKVGDTEREEAVA